MRPVQIVTPNPDIPCKPGWCLAYVNEAYGVRKVYGSATAAWEASATQHRDYNFPPGCWVPVWFALANEPAGHVALRAPDGSVYSTSDLTSIPHHHPDLNDLISYYAYYGMPLTYLGWTEDVEGTPVLTADATGLAAMGSTITRLQEDDVLNDDDKVWLGEKLYAVLEDPNVLEKLRTAIINDATLKNVQGTVLPTLNAHAQNLWDGIQSIPAAVLNQTFKLADGTVTNLSGILAAIHARPVAGGTTIQPADPQAVVKALAAQLSK